MLLIPIGLFFAFKSTAKEKEATIENNSVDIAPIFPIAQSKPSNEVNFIRKSGVAKVPKGKDATLTYNFSSSEMDCKCKYPECTYTLIDMDHIKKLQQMRDEVGLPITITSGYRCERYNKAVGGAPGSQHTQGKATDIKVAGYSPSQIYYKAMEMGFGGVGLYDTFTHVDSRSLISNIAKWDYRKNKQVV